MPADSCTQRRYKEDTIVAIATPPGRGAIGIVRLSGHSSYQIALILTNLDFLHPREARYCVIETQSGEMIDKGLLLYFKAPFSFTGEDVIEFQVHGSPFILDTLVNTCVELGASLAKPGQFTERAFLNSKIDLTQAEAIADLISASSLTASRMALRSLQGDFAKKIYDLAEKIIQLRVYVEAAIDFPEEEIDFLTEGDVITKLQLILEDLKAIQARVTQGVVIREGLSVVITGQPNAGKSTLINALVGREIAIVTEVAGTTRDVMREHVLVDDIPICLIDTAGLRETKDIVEKEGVRRAWEELARADCVVMVMDITQDGPSLGLNKQIREALPEKVPIIPVFNKIDKLESLPPQSANALYLSAKTGIGFSELREKIKAIASYQPEEGLFLARRRHLDALERTYNLLLNGQEQLLIMKAGELLADDLRLAHNILGEITGEYSTDDLLGELFSNFCIGK